VCDNTCSHASDGDCDDGGPGSEYNLCTAGTDCTDCSTTDDDYDDAGSGSYDVSNASLVAASLVGAKKAALAAKEAAAASRAGVPSMTVIGGLVAVVGGVAAVAALRRRRSADTPQML
jgi:hypothetical protein